MATINICSHWFRLWWENTVVQAYQKDGASRIGEYKRLSGNFYVAETLLQCDVSGITAGSTINSVQITGDIVTNNLAGAGTQTLNVKKQDQGSWTDSPTTQPDYDTPFSTSTAWPSALSTVSVTSSSTNFTIPTSASLVSLIQGWVNGTGTAHDGLILDMDASYYDWWFTANNIQVTVDYTLPANNGAGKSFLMFS